MLSKIYRFTLKAPLAILIILTFLFYSSLGELLLCGRIKTQRRFFSRTTSFFSKLLLAVLNITIMRSGALNPLKNSSQGRLFLSNHLSYLDILLISSSYKALFITSKEVEKTFFLGRMAKMGGSFFIERRTPTKLLSEIDRIKAAIKDGFDIVLFPEGTSGNGEDVLPFKKSLLACAVGIGSPVQPLCLKYLQVNGKTIDNTNRDLVYWYGDMTFFKSFASLLFKTDKIEVELALLPELFAPAHLKESESRKIIANEAYQVIQQTFHN